jgi:hypothetical protein
MPAGVVFRAISAAPTADEPPQFCAAARRAGHGNTTPAGRYLPASTNLIASIPTSLLTEPVMFWAQETASST